MVWWPITLPLQIACGWIFVRREPLSGPERLALAHLCGAAAVGAGLTAALALTGRAHPLGPLLGLLILAIAGQLPPRRADGGERAPSGAEGGGAARPGWGCRLLLLAAATGLLTAVARAALLPFDWDGWAIWQLKAKALSAGSLRQLLTAPEFGYSHPDYPLLWPAQVWWLCGPRYSEDVAQAAGLLFLLDLLVLFREEARRRVPRFAALAGVVVILSWPTAVKHAVSGFADLPLAAYVLACAVLVSRGVWRPASACLLGALLTKNEGLFTLAGVGLAVAAGAAGGEPMKAGARARWMLLAATPGIACLGAWFAVRRRWDLPSEMLDPSLWPKSPAEIAARVPIIARAYALQIVWFGPKYPGWGFLWPAALWALARSVRQRRRDTAAFWLVAGAHFAGATIAYLATPLNVAEHLGSSLERLWLHAAPVVLLATLSVSERDHGA